MPFPPPHDQCPGSGHPTGWTGPAPKDGGVKVILCAYCERPLRRTATGKVPLHSPTPNKHDIGKMIAYEKERQLT